MSRKSQEKEAARRADIAQQTEASLNELNQWLAQLVPGSEEYRQLQAQGQALVQGTAGEGDQQAEIRALGSQLVQQQQDRVGAGGAATPLEARTNLAVQGIRDKAAFTPEESDVFRALRGEASESELGRLFEELIGKANAPPEDLGSIDSLFAPELELLQDRVNREANARGLASSGIPLEKLGRAGVELAIQEALRREEVRRTRQLDQENLRRDRLSDVERLFQTGQTLRGREIGVEEAVTNLQAGRESNLTGLLERQSSASVENLLELLASRTTREEQLRDVASALREAERQRNEAFFTDTPEISIGPVKVGARTPSKAFSNAPTAPTSSARSDVGSLLSSQRGTVSQTGEPIDLSQTLNLNPPRRRRQSGFSSVQTV